MKKYLSFVACALALVACSNGHDHSCAYYRSNLESPVYFEFGTANITAESKKKISEGVVFLQNHRFKHVQLDGYADEIGGDTESNMELSRDRVEAVRDFLVENGVAKRRISMSWHGVRKGKPYNKNRRVEITVK